LAARYAHNRLPDHALLAIRTGGTQWL